VSINRVSPKKTPRSRLVSLAKPYGLQLATSIESAVEKGLEKMVGLAFGFALLRAQSLETPNNGGESLLERK